jgi:hypothetical protein
VRDPLTGRVPGGLGRPVRLAPRARRQGSAWPARSSRRAERRAGCCLRSRASAGRPALPRVKVREGSPSPGPVTFVRPDVTSVAPLPPGPRRPLASLRLHDSGGASPRTRSSCSPACSSTRRAPRSGRARTRGPS